MPIGTSDGSFYKDFFEKQRSERLYVSPMKPPSGDEAMVIDPRKYQMDKELNSQQADDELFGGTEVSFKTPLGGPTEPAGALKPPEGSQVPDKGALLEKDYLKAISGVENPRPVMDILGDFAKEKLTNIYEALKLPGDAWQGKIDPMSPEGIEKTNTLAGLMVFGPAPVARSMAEGTLGSFAGVTAKGADKNALAEAQIMKANGAHPDEVWTKTGWFQGADNRWRWEIDDSFSKYRVGWRSGKEDMKIQKPLPEVLNHPELYSAYPSFKDITVVNDPKVHGAYWDKSKQEVVIGKGFKDSQVHGTIMHELQHAIQDQEGFAKGGSNLTAGVDYQLKYTPDVEALIPEIEALGKIPLNQRTPYQQERSAYLKKVGEKFLEYTKAANQKAEDLYARLTGEVEARNVETRLEMSERARRFNPPDVTEDTARNLQMSFDTVPSTTAYGYHQHTGKFTPAKNE